MMRAELDELLIVAALCPGWRWSAVPARRLIVAEDDGVLRLYQTRISLWLEPGGVERLLGTLNREEGASMT